MSHTLTVELSETAYTALEHGAQAAARSPAELAALALEQRFGMPDNSCESGRLWTETEKQMARERFERHFGTVNLGQTTGADNESIDADLARVYADSHEDS